MPGGKGHTGATKNKDTKKRTKSTEGKTTDRLQNGGCARKPELKPRFCAGSNWRLNVEAECVKASREWVKTEKRKEDKKEEGRASKKRGKRGQQGIEETRGRIIRNKQGAKNRIVGMGVGCGLLLRQRWSVNRGMDVKALQAINGTAMG